jgi:hypothetical protein
MDSFPSVDVRPLDVTRHQDIEQAYEIVRDCELHAAGWTDSTLASVTAHLTGPHAWLDQHRFASVDGRDVGVLVAERNAAAREVFLDAFAVGDRSGEAQRGLLSLGLTAAIATAAEDADAAYDGTADPYEISADFWQVLAGTVTQDEGYAAEIRALGFRYIRRFWRMVCDLAGASLDEPAPPAGVSRRIVAGEADEQLRSELGKYGVEV